MCDTYDCDYLKHSTFRFNLVVFQLDTDFPSQFCVFTVKSGQKNCYIGVTRPTLKLGPTLHSFKTKKNKKKKKKEKKKRPTDPKKSKT